MKFHTGMTAVLTNLGKKKETAYDEAQYAYQATYASKPYLAIIGVQPIPLSEEYLNQSTQRVQAWLRVVHRFDFRNLDDIEDNLFNPIVLTVPICDTQTERLLLICTDDPFYVNYASVSRPIHEYLLRLKAKPSPGSLAASASESSTGSSGRSSSSILPSSRHAPAVLPSCVYVLGRFAVAPLVKGQHSRNGHEPTSFAAVVDAADPSMPLWAVRIDCLMDSVQGEYLTERPHRSNPFYRILPLEAPASGDGVSLYDAVLLGRLTDARLRRGTIFPLKTVLRYARRSRGIRRPSLHGLPETEAVAAVGEGWKTVERRSLWKRVFPLSL